MTMKETTGATVMILNLSMVEVSPLKLIREIHSLLEMTS